MYFYGLGEFFYTNGIDVDEESFMKMKCTTTQISPLSGGVSRSDKGVVKEQQFGGNLICI
ncbi:hypothetical protein J5751_05460 [bacterium]|nr:hypothetical protein [bacterium]